MNNIEPKDSDLFGNLSENEQESVAGGCISGLHDLFIQRTEIVTFGGNQLDISADTGNLSSSQNSAYSMTQTTIGVNFDSLFGNSSKRRFREMNSMLRMFMFLF